jgi:hypothetical protein
VLTHKDRGAICYEGPVEEEVGGDQLHEVCINGNRNNGANLNLSLHRLVLRVVRE